MVQCLGIPFVQIYNWIFTSLSLSFSCCAIFYFYEMFRFALALDTLYVWVYWISLAVDPFFLVCSLEWVVYILYVGTIQSFKHVYSHLQWWHFYVHWQNTPPEWGSKKIVPEMNKHENETYQRFIAHHFKYRSSFRVYWLSQ